jgi:hypothetical protein
MSEQVLRKVLWVDTIGSGLSTAITIVGAGVLADLLGVSAWIPFGVGLVLIPWVLHLLRTVRHEPLRPADVGVIVAGNVGWAVAAAVLILGFPTALTTPGNWLVGVFSLGVLALGVMQWIGLRGLVSTAETAVA